MEIIKANSPSADSRNIDGSIDTEKCPSCSLPFALHSNYQLVNCALNELRGDKKD